MISQKAKYALRALSALARGNQAQPRQILEIAIAQNIPKKFLEQILLDLKREGIVRSLRGKQGGYLLLRPAREITFGEVLRIIDGPLAPLPCLSITAYRRCDDCNGELSCEIRHVFHRVAEAERAVLFSATIADGIALADSAMADDDAPAEAPDSTQVENGMSDGETSASEKPANASPKDESRPAILPEEA